jgi:hypothetical protein
MRSSVPRLVVTAVFLLLGRSPRDRYAEQIEALVRGRIRFFTIIFGVGMAVLITITLVGAGAIGAVRLLT